MKASIFGVLLTVCMLLASPVRADVVVLVHGYLSGPASWERSGITSILQQHGWRSAGVYLAGPAGIQHFPVTGARAERSFYAVDLPSEAPVLVQVHMLRNILASISRTHGNEPVVLVGHSAGGVVARTALVRGAVGNIRALVTIASPHLGTARAEQALDATDIPFPFSIIPDVLAGDIYDTAKRSRNLYVDLVRPRPGTLLYWLNAQPHPDIEYFSIVRGDSVAGQGGDFIVPPYSQDMNNVPALRGRSSLVTIPSRHHLHPLDGSVLVNLIADL